VVYHGFAGHFFVKEIAHVLKVRIVADMEERIRLVMERNHVSREEAVASIHKIDEQRRKWSKQFYGIETSDPRLYDLVINIGQTGLEDAVDIICHKIGLDHFQPTAESQQALADLCLAAEVKSMLVDLKPDIQVTSHKGMVRVVANASATQKLELKMRKISETIPGINNYYFDAAPLKSHAANQH
jgi:hypothetical protein